jgi:hypothetical protein
MITAKSQEGLTNKELLFNSMVILASKYDSIEFPLPESDLAIIDKIVFRFDDDGEKFTSTVNPSFIKNKILDITLHKWYSSYFVENSKPMEFRGVNSIYVINWRTSCQERLSQRTFHLSVWRIING